MGWKYSQRNGTEPRAKMIEKNLKENIRDKAVCSASD